MGAKRARQSNRGEFPMKLNLSVKSAGQKARVFVTPGMFYNK